jgi:hypothetical protein
MATWETNIARVATTEEGRFNAIAAACRSLARAARVLEVVVYALRDEDEIGEAEVDCECDDGGNETSPQCAGKVGDIPYKPNCEEGERDAFSGALLVVLNELGNLGRLAEVKYGRVLQ